MEKGYLCCPLEKTKQYIPEPKVQHVVIDNFKCETDKMKWKRIIEKYDFEIEMSEEDIELWFCDKEGMEYYFTKDNTGDYVCYWGNSCFHSKDINLVIDFLNENIDW